jgi:hypothetical protein
MLSIQAGPLARARAGVRPFRMRNGRTELVLVAVEPLKLGRARLRDQVV